MSKRLDLMSPEELAELRKHFNGLGLDMTLERYVELKSELTDKELVLAAEYETLGDDPARRDAIRKELYNLRWKLNSENDRKYNTTGKGRYLGAICEAGLPAATRPSAPRRQANVVLPKELQHAMPTLRAIMRNGSDRSLSIRELAAERGITFTAARKKYFADRKKLMNLLRRDGNYLTQNLPQMLKATKRPLQIARAFRVSVSDRIGGLYSVTFALRR